MTCPVCAQQIHGRGYYISVPLPLNPDTSIPKMSLPASAMVEAIVVCSHRCGETLNEWMALQRDWRSGLYWNDRPKP